LAVFLYSKAKPPAPISTINMSNDVVSRKEVPFGGPENKVLRFNLFPKKMKGNLKVKRQNLKIAISPKL